MKEINEYMIFSVVEVAKLLSTSAENGVGVDKIAYYIDRGDLRSIIIDNNEVITGKALLLFLSNLEIKQAEERMNKQLLDDLNQD